MAKVVDPRHLPDTRGFVPGLKPPIREFSPTDNGDPAEVDIFNQMIRDLRDQRPGDRSEAR